MSRQKLTCKQYDSMISSFFTRLDKSSLAGAESGAPGPATWVATAVPTRAKAIMLPNAVNCTNTRVDHGQASPRAHLHCKCSQYVEFENGERSLSEE